MTVHEQLGVVLCMLFIGVAVYNVLKGGAEAFTAVSCALAVGVVLKLLLDRLR